ncbi:MAG TPA: PAS domain-containing protein [Chloroflexi bacterium]|nr:PAS domain-containing protein [Chloroflexota bacterium]
MGITGSFQGRTERGNNSPERDSVYQQLFRSKLEAQVLVEALRDSQGQVQDWIFRDVNEAFLAYFKLKLDQLLNVRASELAQPPEQLTFLMEKMRSVDRSGKPLRLEDFFPNDDRLYLFTIYPLDGDMFAGSILDITSYKKAQDELRASRERLAFTTQAAEVGLWDWNLERNHMEWNEQMRSLVGVGPDQPVSFDLFYERVHPEDRDALDDSIRRVMEGIGRDFETELRVVHPDESIRWLQALGSAEVGADGQPAIIRGLVVDITRRRLAELERERIAFEHYRQTELLQRLVREAPFAIALTTGPQHRFLLANPAFQALRDRPGRIIGRPIARIWPGAAAQIVPLLDRVYQNGDPVSALAMPLWMQRDGVLELAFFNITINPTFDEAGAIDGTILLLHETTQEVLANRQADLEQKRLEVIVQYAPIGIILVDEAGQPVRINPIAAQLLGDLAEDKPFDPDRIAAWFSYADGGRVKADDLPPFCSALRGETVQNLEMVIRRPGSPVVQVLASSAPVINREGVITGAVGVLQDITESKRAEVERSQAAAQIEIHHHLMESREMERLQIAHHLHEGLLQELIGLQFSIGEALDKPQRAERLKQMDTIRRTLSEVTDDLRDYCYSLRPPALAPFGLEKAIRSHVESYRQKYAGLEVHLELLPDAQLLPEPIRLVLFRVYQEVMNNIAKHSNATDAFVRFVFNSREAQLEIRDNGVGFAVPKTWVESARSGRIGLVAAQERVESVGGALEIQSAPGEGTLVRVRVPLNSRDADGAAERPAGGDSVAPAQA